jgi:hypothetical protein
MLRITFEIHLLLFVPAEMKEEESQPSPGPTFQIYSEEAVTNHQEPPKTPAFAIYSEENPAAPASSSKAPFAVYQDKENMPVDKENSAATRQRQPSARQLSGVLKPSSNVRYIPLDVQEAVIDEDERRQERELGLIADEDEGTLSFERMPPPAPIIPTPSVPPVRQNANSTIALPSEDAFAEMAHLVSTPYHGRRNFDDEDNELDEFTSAVQIEFKKPRDPVIRVQQELQHPAVAPADEEPAAEAANLFPLSPIMETSREYKSSSTSSGQSLMTNLTKSHWGNTHLGCTTTNARTPGSMLLSKTVANTVRKHHPSEMTCSSGYMADSSSARTPGLFLIKSGREIANEEEEEEDKIEEQQRKRAEQSPKQNSEEKKPKLSQSFQVKSILCKNVTD